MNRERAAGIATRLVFFLGAAILLAVICRQGSSLFKVGLAFILYVVAVALWVSGQHQASSDAAKTGDLAKRPWTFPYWLSLPAVGVGVLIFAGGYWLHVGTALLAGALCAYFGAGYVLMRFRQLGTDGVGGSRVKIGGVGLGVSAGLVVAGLILMEGSPWAIWLLVAGLLTVPAGLAVLAEPAVIRLRDDASRRPWVIRLAVVGFLLLVGSILIAALRVDGAWVVVAFAALALLVFAMVSSTQADIAAVIGAVALMGVTPLSEHKPADLDPQPGHQRVLVALGDSYMSGEGAELYYAEEADEREKGTQNRCHRAPTAWAAMAGQTNRLFDSVAFLACSGARSYHVWHEGSSPMPGATARRQFNEPGTQLDQVDALKQELGQDFNPALVVLSLGGNDAGFSTIGTMCIAPGNCRDQAHLWEQTLDQVSAGLTQTYEEIREEFPNAPVLVAAYPAPIYTNAAGEVATCSQVALEQGDLQFISSFVPKLNATVKEAALAQRFYFLDQMEFALADARLQLCDPDNDNRPGINFIGLRSVAGIAEQRFNPKNWYHNSLHPNARGHAAMLQVFEEWRAQNPMPPRDNPEAATAQPPKASGATEQPICDLVGSDENTVQCRDLGSAWTNGQVRDQLLLDWWGIQLVAAALGAWLLGVAYFSWWRPWWPPRPSSQ